MVMCFAPTCKHYSQRDLCKFYTFPKETEELKTWIRLIRRQDRDPGKNSRICSCHFLDGSKVNGPTIHDYNMSKQFPSYPKTRKKRLPNKQPKLAVEEKPVSQPSPIESTIRIASSDFLFDNSKYKNDVGQYVVYTTSSDIERLPNNQPKVMVEEKPVSQPSPIESSIRIASSDFLFDNSKYKNDVGQYVVYTGSSDIESDHEQENNSDTLTAPSCTLAASSPRDANTPELCFASAKFEENDIQFVDCASSSRSYKDENLFNADCATSDDASGYAVELLQKENVTLEIPRPLNTFVNMNHFIENVHRDSSVPETLRSESKLRFSYLGDFDESDLESPEKRVLFFTKANDTIKKLKAKVKMLQQRVRRLEQRKTKKICSSKSDEFS